MSKKIVSREDKFSDENPANIVRKLLKYSLLKTIENIIIDSQVHTLFSENKSIVRNKNACFLV